MLSSQGQLEPPHHGGALFVPTAAAAPRPLIRLLPHQLEDLVHQVLCIDGCAWAGGHTRETLIQVLRFAEKKFFFEKLLGHGMARKRAGRERVVEMSRAARWRSPPPKMIFISRTGCICCLGMLDAGNQVGAPLTLAQAHSDACYATVMARQCQLSMA